MASFEKIDAHQAAHTQEVNQIKIFLGNLGLSLKAREREILDIYIPDPDESDKCRKALDCLAREKRAYKVTCEYMASLLGEPVGELVDDD